MTELRQAFALKQEKDRTMLEVGKSFSTCIRLALIFYPDAISSILIAFLYINENLTFKDTDAG